MADATDQVQIFNRRQQPAKCTQPLRTFSASGFCGDPHQPLDFTAIVQFIPLFQLPFCTILIHNHLGYLLLDWLFFYKSNPTGGSRWFFNLFPHSRAISGMKTSTFIRLATALLVAVAAYILGHWFFFDLPFTTDENSYVFQAHNFLEGCVARRVPPVPWAFYHPMIICDEQVGWLSRYPPAHSLWLAPGVLLGNARLM
ncbi:MAG: hypothetical protein KKA28_20005, partial [Planctomycetes bacterium]|nr:hypothetical protein [Planctomycetota bacterium]